MTTSFWQTLDALGSAGGAACDWRRLLGGDWPACAGLLRSAGSSADCVIDPDRPGRHLTVEADGEAGFIGFANEPPLRPPVPLAAGDVEFRDAHVGGVLLSTLARGGAGAVGGGARRGEIGRGAAESSSQRGAWL